jgi:hypothetical protein
MPFTSPRASRSTGPPLPAACSAVMRMLSRPVRCEQRWQQPLDECPLAVVQRCHLPIYALVIYVEPLEGDRACGEERKWMCGKRARRAAAVRLALAMRVRSQGRNSRMSWGRGVFEACEDGGCSGAVAADKDDVGRSPIVMLLMRSINQRPR